MHRILCISPHDAKRGHILMTKYWTAIPQDYISQKGWERWEIKDQKSRSQQFRYCWMHILAFEALWKSFKIYLRKTSDFTLKAFCVICKIWFCEKACILYSYNDIGNFASFIQIKQDLDTVESWLLRMKGLNVGKHRVMIAVMFTNHELLLYSRAVQPCKIAEKV